MKILQVFHLQVFLGGKYISKIIYWNFLSFRGLLYVLGHFNQKKFISIFFPHQFTLFICGFTYQQKPVLDWDCSLKTGKKDQDWDRRSQQD